MLMTTFDNVARYDAKRKVHYPEEIEWFWLGVAQWADWHGVDPLEVWKMVGKLLNAEFDPVADPGGDLFRWDDWAPRDDPFFLSVDVPEPDAVVDVLEAWERAKLDARRCARALVEGREGDGKVSERMAVTVFVNSLKWSKFWARRHPDAEWRRKFAEDAERGIGDLEGMLEKVMGRGRSH
jgi:hypothetical protein